MKQVPNIQLPGADEIKKWALMNLPEYYTLRKIGFYIGCEWPDLMPDDLELTIEYENHLDEAVQGSNSAIQDHHGWADPLVKKIRAGWDKKSLRIVFDERSAEPGRLVSK